MTKTKKTRCMFLFCVFLIMIIMSFGGYTDNNGGKTPNNNNSNNNGNTDLGSLIFVKPPFYENVIKKYNGQEQQLQITTSEYYSISGDKATEIGKYTAIIVLKNKNYKWLDGKYRPYNTLHILWEIVEADTVKEEDSSTD